MPGASSSKLKFLVRDILLQDSDVTDLVGSSVYGHHLQAPDVSTVSYPMVVLEVKSGVTDVSSFQKVVLDLYAYSRTSAGEALALYDACQKRLQQEILRRDGIDIAGYAVEQTRPNEGYNDIVRGYYCVGEFMIRMVNK